MANRTGQAIAEQATTDEAEVAAAAFAINENGGGGGGFEDIELVVGISAPAQGAALTAGPTGTSIPVSGTAQATQGTVSEVWVRAGAGAEVRATPGPNGLATWSCTIATTLSDAVPIVARGKGAYRTLSLEGESAPVTVTIRDVTAPSLTLDPISNPPLPPGQVTGPGSTFPVTLRGGASDAVSGVSYVQYSVAGGQPLRATEDATGWARWHADFNLTLGTHQVAVTSFDRANNPTTAQVTVTAVDTTAPTLVISEPIDNKIVQSTNVPVSGTAQDTQSGVDRVMWQLGSDPPRPATRGTDGSSWSATVPIGTFGPQVITISAYDKHGRVATDKRTVTYEAPRTIAWNPDDALSYYFELLDFAKKRVVLTATNQAVTDFAAVFFQPFDQLTATQRDERVAVVRLAVEVLRKYLVAKPPSAPLADALRLAETAYRQAAYESLLTRVGASFEEVRLARSAEPAKRKELADRLGIDLSPTRPDELDSRLLLLGTQVTEAALERLFGLRDTTRADLLSPTPVADLLGWQRARLRRLWKQQDAAAATPALPLVEPDLLTAADLAPSTSNPARTLLQQRQALVTGQVTAMANDRPAGETPLARFDRLVAAALAPTATVAMLQAMDAARKEGKNIERDPLSTGRVAHWRFDESAGTTAADTSGNGNNGMVKGATFVAGKVGNALGFDGVDDIVTLGPYSHADLVNSFTVAFWANPQATLRSTRRPTPASAAGESSGTRSACRRGADSTVRPIMPAPGSPSGPMGSASTSIPTSTCPRCSCTRRPSPAGPTSPSSTRTGRPSSTSTESSRRPDSPVRSPTSTSIPARSGRGPTTASTRGRWTTSASTTGR